MISRRQFAVDYNKANVAATGRKARSADITEAYELHKGFAADMGAPNAVPVFSTKVSREDGKLDWDIDLNVDKQLKPTRGYFDPKLTGEANATLK